MTELDENVQETECALPVISVRVELAKAESKPRDLSKKGRAKKRTSGASRYGFGKHNGKAYWREV